MAMTSARPCLRTRPIHPLDTPANTDPIAMAL
jgi:hypothetical protein